MNYLFRIDRLLKIVYFELLFFSTDFVILLVEMTHLPARSKNKNQLVWITWVDFYPDTPYKKLLPNDKNIIIPNVLVDMHKCICTSAIYFSSLKDDQCTGHSVGK